MENLKRNCPKCNKILIYKYLRSFKCACIQNRYCRSCGAKFKPKRDEQFYENIAWNKTCKEHQQILLNYPNLQKECPKCNKIIKYKNKTSLIKSVKNNTWCNSCIQKRDIKLGIRKSWNKGKKMNDVFKKKIKTSWKITKNKRCGNYHPFYGKTGPMTGKTHSEETRHKQRLSHIEYIKNKYGNNKFTPNYNKIACKYLNKFDNNHKIKILHAENGGEFKYRGFFADGYIPNKNIWIEYDESKHYFGGILRKKELDRQIEIENHLRCKFIRIKECKNYNEFESILLKFI